MKKKTIIHHPTAIYKKLIDNMFRLHEIFRKNYSLICIQKQYVHFFKDMTTETSIICLQKSKQPEKKPERSKHWFKLMSQRVFKQVKNLNFMPKHTK